VILRHGRRQIVSIGVTSHPTAQWIARQIGDAFPWDETPRYLIRDRDAAYGHAVRLRLQAMGIRDRPTAPRSPWQNAYAERLVGSIRRECLDHIIVLSEAHLRRILKAYTSYYNGVRTHLSLRKDAPFPPFDRADRTYLFDTDPRWPAPSVLPDIVSDRHNHRQQESNFCADQACDGNALDLGPGYLDRRRRHGIHHASRHVASLCTYLAFFVRSGHSHPNLSPHATRAPYSDAIDPLAALPAASRLRDTDPPFSRCILHRSLQNYARHEAVMGPTELLTDG
jgi:integrase-like protein